MTEADLIRQALQSGFDRALEVYERLCPGQTAALARVKMRRDLSVLHGLLRQLLGDPKRHGKVLPGTTHVQPQEVVEIKKVVAVKKPVEAAQPREYPGHYPPLLQHMLEEAMRKITLKRRLSNTLYSQRPNSAHDTVKRVSSLSADIDEIFQAKKSFDRNGFLPDKFLRGLKIETNEIAELETRIRLCRTWISKLKAKLHNPDECAKGEPKEWREKLREEERHKVELQQQLYTIRTNTAQNVRL